MPLSRILLYLSFNAIGYLFLLITIMGTPGNLDPDKPGTKFLIKLADFLLLVAWKGMPVLLIASIAAFCFKYPFVGKLSSILGLSIGLALFLTMIGIYKTQ